MHTRQKYKKKPDHDGGREVEVTSEVSRNTCHPKHHLEEFTGSKSLIV